MAKPKSVASMTGDSMKNVHAVMRTAHHPANVVVRHPAHVGPHMLAPQADYVEPKGAKIQQGGVIGGLAPFQKANAIEMPK